MSRTRRREFIRRAAAVAAAVAAAPQASAAQRGGGMPTARAAAFMSLLGLKYPIACAGMGGPSGPDLAAAVSNAGGFGAVGTGGTRAVEAIQQRVKQTRALTTRPFAINFLLHVDLASALSAALDAGAPIVQFAWGMPGKDSAAAIRGAGAKMGVQVSSVDGAKQSLDAGADYLICQGTEAGGHVQATRPLYDVLPAIIAEAKQVPVLACGGIATGVHIKRALTVGASGVLIGTRFVATRESLAHDDYKAVLAKARASDTTLTVCFQDGWVNAPHRVLRNRTLEIWEAAGCPQPGKRPGEADVVATSAAGTQRRRYGTNSPGRGDQGQLMELVLYAGQGVDGIRDIPGAGDLVARLWKECLDA